ncbi:MAG: methyltransferase domain-containing protein [Anaerolineaceae bacterium]|nr:methyltransferase domain-containing protein [Anaerolineaceae bacterium]
MNEKPPICSYEGSDYQTSFWEHGGRAYEDAVEEIALKRLLPENGKLLLELGAGAGRNTHRYEGFEKIVLLDYSRTQLEQARERLGTKDRFRYVAADVYHLPFVNGLFDCSTMIRTLHHMAEPRLALEQVRNVLKEQAIFILEYANKKNVKSILRYLLGRQDWNPFTPEPVEFVSLNYDFHPSTVCSWLESCNFVVERQLTVSHLRMNFLKKIIPIKLMIAMDSLFQLTGDMWQLTPSVFARTQAVGDTSKVAIGGFFRCPSCGNQELEDTPPEIICPDCQRVYPVVNDIYDFRLDVLEK